MVQEPEISLCPASRLRWKGQTPFRFDLIDLDHLNYGTSPNHHLWSTIHARYDATHFVQCNNKKTLFTDGGPNELYSSSAVGPSRLADFKLNDAVLLDLVNIWRHIVEGFMYTNVAWQ